MRMNMKDYLNQKYGNETKKIIKPKNSYNPLIDGGITAIRIFEKNGGLPQAELIFAFGKRRTINWVNIEERKLYEPGINGYTFILDERINENIIINTFKKEVERCR